MPDAVRLQLKAQGTQVVAVYAGFIDTDMAAGFDRPKTSPEQVAERTLQGVMAGTDDVHADTRAEELWRALKTDPGQIAQQIQQLWPRLQPRNDNFLYLVPKISSRLLLRLLGIDYWPNCDYSRVTGYAYLTQ